MSQVGEEEFVLNLRCVGTLCKFLIKIISEHFCLGKRRLHVFGRDSSIRPGWLTVGPDLSNSNYDYNTHQSYFSNGTVMRCPERIETLRPKSPPPKSGMRGGRGGRGGGRGRGKGKGDGEGRTRK